MITIRSQLSPAPGRRLRRRGVAALATSLALGAALAPAVAAPPSSARTFEFNRDVLVQNPLPSDWNCLYRQAVAERPLACH
jgi:hypothetical protein